VVILVEPQMGENIGAAARAMANFGLSRLRLVKPREEWPNPQARKMASGADRVLDAAVVYDTLQSAIADCTLLLATTARAHDQAKPVIDAADAAQHAAPPVHGGESVGILFGRERTGLEKDDIALADAVVTVPLNPDFTSLNLAQAVLLLGYEWYQAGDSTPPRVLEMHGSVPATKDQLYAFFAHFERALDECGFLRNEEARPNMIRNMRNMWGRAELTEQEIRTLHGVVKELTTLREKKRP